MSQKISEIDALYPSELYFTNVHNYIKHLATQVTEHSSIHLTLTLASLGQLKHKTNKCVKKSGT